MSIRRELDTRDSVKVVTSNNFLRACGLEHTTLKARKLLYLAISQCRLNDNQFYEYKISARDFADLMQISPSHVYDEADSITDELMKGFIKYIPDGKKRFKKFHLFERCEYTDNAEIIFELHKEMTPICLDLKRDFSQPLLSDFLRMRSNYSMILFHYFVMKMKKYPGTKRISFYCSLEELREVTGCDNKFKQLGQFREKVLDRAISEIYSNSGIDINYTYKRKGRTVIGFNFIATSFGIDLTDFEPSIECLEHIAEFNKKQQNIS